MGLDMLGLFFCPTEGSCRGEKKGTTKKKNAPCPSPSYLMGMRGLPLDGVVVLLEVMMTTY